MKKLLILVLVVFGLWNYFSKNAESTKVQEIEISVPRAEAEYFVKNCPNTKMDGDRDGIPCENDSRF